MAGRRNAVKIQARKRRASPTRKAAQERIHALLVKAIEIYGSEAALGEACGCSQRAINRAKHLGRVTPQMAIAVERATKNKISRAQLCPEVFSVALAS